MNKLPVLALSFLLFVLLAFPVNVLAAVNLTSIGSLDTSDTAYSQYWYTGENPVLTGTATASDTVTISVDGVAATTTADASGNWSYVSTGLVTGGDYALVISDSTDTYSFTLTIGSLPSDLGTTQTSTTSASDLPVTGGLTTTLLLLAGAGLLITAPFIINKFAFAQK